MIRLNKRVWRSIRKKLSRVHKRTHIHYVTKKDGTERFYILHKVLSNDDTHLFVSVYEKGENGRPKGEPVKRKLIKSRIQSKKFIW